MANLHELRETTLQAKRHEFYTDVVTIQRGTLRTTDVKATVGRKQTGNDSEDATVEEWRSRDFLFRPQDYAFGGTQSEPRNGDRIEIIRGGKTEVYEVLPMAGDKCSQPSGLSIRVHTKFVMEKA